MSKNSRTSQICGTNDTDFISNLPDGVIGHILSCLPIKDVVCTSVLSKDWQFKWTSVYNVKLESEVILPEPRQVLALAASKKKVLTLVNIAEKLLIRLGSLRSFSLTCFIWGGDELSRMSTLLHALFRRDIEILKLVVGDHDDLVLPLSILNRTSLRDFEFTMDCILKVPVENGFPNLRSLLLSGVKMLNEISENETLIFTFPVLKTFKLWNCNWMNVKYVEIYAPALTTFDISTNQCYEWNDPYSYSIKVLGSHLSMFRVAGDYIENINLSDSTVSNADLSCYHDNSLLVRSGIQARKLLRQLSNIKSLMLSEMLLAIASVKEGNLLPRFDKLEELHVYPPFDAEGLLLLLQAAPFLRILRVPTYDCDYDFDAVESLPSCVLIHLEEIIFDYADCSSMEYLDFLVEKFFLKNGLQLETVLVSVSDTHAPSSLKNEIVVQLLTFPKGSTCLTISVET